MTTGEIVLWCVAAVAAVADWWSRWRRGERAARVEEIAKPATTAALLGIAALGGADGGTRTLAVLALLCCLIGDVALLARRERFIVGLAAFLFGHVLLAALFAVIGVHANGWMWAGLAVVAALVVGVARPIVVGAAAHRLRLPVLVYLTVIGVMAVLGWSTARPWLAVGATSFVVSDALLGWDRFVAPRRWMSVAVMVTYHLALAGLVIGVR